MDFPSFLLDACCHHNDANDFYEADDLTENDLSLDKESLTLRDDDNKTTIDLWQEHEDRRVIISKNNANTVKEAKTPANLSTVDSPATILDLSSPETSLEQESSPNVAADDDDDVHQPRRTAARTAGTSSNLHRVLSFSSANLVPEQQPQEPVVPMTPTTTTSTLKPYAYRNKDKPLVPPSAVAGARRRPILTPAVANNTTPHSTDDDDEQTAAFAVTAGDSTIEAMPKPRQSIVSTLVAKMNAANHAFQASLVQENTQQDQDDEWSEEEDDSLLNMTDDEGEDDEFEQMVVQETQHNKEATTELQNAMAQAVTLDGFPVIPSEAQPNELVLEQDKSDNDDDDSSSSNNSLPIVFDDEFGHLPDGDIFSEEDFGGEMIAFAQTPEEEEQEKKLVDDEAAMVPPIQNKKTSKKKKKLGGSLKKKITSMLQKKKNDNYGSLNDDSFEKKTPLLSSSSSLQTSSNNHPSIINTPESPTVLVQDKKNEPVVAASTSTAPAGVPVFSISPPRATTTTSDPWSTETINQAAFSVSVRNQSPSSPPAIHLAISDDSFSPSNDPWSTETTEAAFPMVPTEPTKILANNISTPASPIEPSKQDTPPYHPNNNASSSSPQQEDSWQQLLHSVTNDKQDDLPFLQNDSSWSDVVVQDVSEDGLPVQFSNGFFKSPVKKEASPGSIPTNHTHVIPLDTTPVQDDASPMIDTSTVQRPSLVAPKKRVTGVANLSKALLEQGNTTTTTVNKKPSIQRTSHIVSPDRTSVRGDEKEEEDMGPSVQDLTDAFDTERPKMVNRKVKAWEGGSNDKTETSNNTSRRSSRLSLRAVANGKDPSHTVRSTSLPKRASTRTEPQTRIVSPDRPKPTVIQILHEDKTIPSVQDLTDAFDTERTPKMVNRKVKALERAETKSETSSTTRRSSSLTKRVSSGAESNHAVRSSSLSKRVIPTKTSAPPPLPKKPSAPVSPMVADVPRKESNNTVETTTNRRSSNVGQMANLFDPPTVSKEHVNKLAGAFEKDTKIFYKPSRIPSNNNSNKERPAVKRSVSSNAISNKATPSPAVPNHRTSEAIPSTDGTERTVASTTPREEETKKVAKRKDLFSYWEKVAVTTKSTPMPSDIDVEENVVVVDEVGSNKEMAMDTSFDFSNPDCAAEPTVDETAWASHQPESDTIFSL